MKNIYLLCSCCMLLSSALFGQIDQPSLGSGYANFTYYNLNDGGTVSYDHTEWDIAFQVDAFGLGIHVNEGVSLSFTAPPAPVELYATNSTDFTDVDTMGMTRIYNDEASWSAGAFNHTADENNPADYGWGTYDFMTHQVNGTRIYIIKLRSGATKKIKIESLIGGVYTFRYANLDGTNEEEHSIAKADFDEKTLVYFSMETGSVQDFEPNTWDLLFTRYVTPIFDGTSDVEYTVTGVLSNTGVSVAKATGVDPTSVNHEDYEDAYSDELNEVGYDWKAFTGMGWDIPQDVAYFIKSTQNQLWKIQFYDFEGSSTGVSTLERTYIGELTHVDEARYEHLSTFDVYPNPAIDYTNIAFEVNSSVQEGQVLLYNSVGQLVLQKEIDIQNGLNVQTLSLDDYPKGVYHVALKIGRDFINKPIAIQ